MRNRRAVIGSLGIAGAVIAWLFLTATGALAHHPIVSGEVGCAPNGQHVITWTIKNSETTSGTNRSMTVNTITVDSGTVVGVAAGAVLPPQSTAGSTREATTTLPGAQVGLVTLTVTASWPSPGPQNVVRTAAVTLHEPCQQPTTTTTAPPTTTTTEPPTTTTTTTVGTTTTTEVDGTTTTVLQVLGEEFTRGDSLPRTGGTGWLLGVALATIAGAVGASVLRRRMTQSAR